MAGSRVDWCGIAALSVHSTVVVCCRIIQPVRRTYYADTPAGGGNRMTSRADEMTGAPSVTCTRPLITFCRSSDRARGRISVQSGVAAAARNVQQVATDQRRRRRRQASDGFRSAECRAGHVISGERYRRVMKTTTTSRRPPRRDLLVAETYRSAAALSWAELFHGLTTAHHCDDSSNSILYSYCTRKANAPYVLCCQIRMMITRISVTLITSRTVVMRLTTKWSPDFCNSALRIAYRAVLWWCPSISPSLRPV